MSTYHKIQIALGTILLWSSASVSSFAVTNTITAEKFQSDAVKLPVQSIPVRPLNSTLAPNLIAGQMRDMFRQIPPVSNLFAKFDEIWKNPADRKKNLFDHCNTQKNFSVDQCFSLLRIWAEDQMETQEFQNIDELENISDEVVKMRQ
ncbi:MAG: hypothetical protein RSE13_02395 [Planktothrix sp. GU0601_MAG3]|nr:MAG: hypothetical protein RSE13_02395 [Planktothrix sp. GU0601_MAG3]